MSDEPSFFDKVTGRDELQDEIAELRERVTTLEEEKDALEEQLEAANERRADAVSEKQAIAEERNKLEDRIATLEDRLQRQEQSETNELPARTIPQSRIGGLLDRIHSIEAGEEGACTAQLHEADALPSSAAEQLSDKAVATLRKRTPCIVLVDDMGICQVALEPPTRFKQRVSWDASFIVDESLFKPPEQFTFGLLRSDTFIAAKYIGTDRETAETIETAVKSDHSKGGFSQGRFERRRDEQIAEHVAAVNDLLADMPDPKIVVGEQQVLSELPADVRTATSGVTGATTEALDKAFREYWSTRVTSL